MKDQYKRTLIILLLCWASPSLFAAPNAYDLYQEARQINRQPNGIKLKSYQVQVKNNLIEDILSYAEEHRPAFFFPEPTLVSQLWQHARPLFTRLEGNDAPLAVKELVGNFLLTSGQIFFYQIYGETERDSLEELRRLRRNSRASLKEDDTTYYLVFTPRDKIIETNVKQIGLVELTTSIFRLEVDIQKKGRVITRVFNKGEVKVSGAEKYQKPLDVVVNIEYQQHDDIYLVSKVHSHPTKGDDFDYLVSYTYTRKDGFSLPEKINLVQTTMKDGEKQVFKVETRFENYQVNKPFSPRAEMEYKSFEEMSANLEEF